MRRYGVQKIIEKNAYRNTQSRFYEVPNSDHHLYFDNPKGFAEMIIEDLNSLPELINFDPQIEKMR